MRIKVINPNTTQSMTEKIDEAARAVVAAGTEVVTVSPRSGPVSIESHYDEAVSAIGVLEEVRLGEVDGTDYRFVRFQVLFDIDTMTQGLSLNSAQPALRFLRLPFSY